MKKRLNGMTDNLGGLLPHSKALRALILPRMDARNQPTQNGVTSPSAFDAL